MFYRVAKKVVSWYLGYRTIMEENTDIFKFRAFKKTAWILLYHENCKRISNCFSLLKTEIRLWMLNTKQFLCHIRGLRYFKTKYGCEMDKFKSILADSCTCSLWVDSGYPYRSQTGPWLIMSNPNWPLKSLCYTDLSKIYIFFSYLDWLRKYAVVQNKKI